MITTFPNELLLEIFCRFPLTTIIAANGVCRKWRDLLLVAEIHPTRQALLGLYRQIIQEPWFADSRPWVLENLFSFDREAYLSALADQHDLPEHFRIWLSEWPAKAAFGGIWPGLPAHVPDTVGPTSDIHRRIYNLLDASNPTVWTIKYINEEHIDLESDSFIVEDVIVEPLPGLPITLEEGGDTTWLLLDKGKFRDQVVQMYLTEREFRARDFDDYTSFWTTWIDFLCHVVVQLQCRHGSDINSFYGTKPSPQPPRTISSTPWTTTSHVPYSRPGDEGEEE
ncbi:hypothetical protein ONZ45_g3812 [Pleurotus djamor]|nr:hypothetical protein ONZ45_g3812 [Pleurotus djamor]